METAKPEEKKNDINALQNQITELKSNQKYEECIKLIQDNISNIAEQYSKDSREYYSISYEVCDICNLIAQDNFLNQNYEEGVAYLEKCVSLFQNYKPILNVCYNNLGHYYRKLGINDKALESYDNAIQVSSELGNKKNVSEGHINYAIILISINKVKLALEQALAGIILLQECLMEKKQNNTFSSNNAQENSNEENKTGKTNNEDIEEYLDIYSMLENSYILVAISHFKLGNTLESLLYYDIAKKLREHVTGDDSNNNDKGEQNEILSDEAKLKMLKESRNEIVKENKKVTERNEKMANNYMRDQITKMIREIEEKNGWSDSPILEDKAYEQMDQMGRFQAMCKKLNNN